MWSVASPIRVTRCYPPRRCPNPAAAERDGGQDTYLPPSPSGDVAVRGWGISTLVIRAYGTPDCSIVQGRSLKKKKLTYLYPAGHRRSSLVYVYRDLGYTALTRVVGT